MPVDVTFSGYFTLDPTLAPLGQMDLSSPVAVLSLPVLGVVTAVPCVPACGYTWEIFASDPLGGMAITLTGDMQSTSIMPLPLANYQSAIFTVDYRTKFLHFEGAIDQLVQIEPDRFTFAGHVASVPEPATAILLSVALLLAMAWRMRSFARCECGS